MSSVPVLTSAQLALNTQLFTAAANQAAFVLPTIPNAVLFVFANGACLYPGDDYSVTAAQITLVKGRDAGDRLMVIYA